MEKVSDEELQNIKEDVEDAIERTQESWERMEEFTVKVTYVPGKAKKLHESFYTRAGSYIGGLNYFKMLVLDRGIIPQPIPPLPNEKCDLRTVCSIGYSKKENLWYGWSHRAIHGFGIGDEVKEGDCTTSSGFTEEYILEHPEKDRSLPVGFKARTMEDARLMAIAFAEAVG